MSSGSDPAVNSGRSDQERTDRSGPGLFPALDRFGGFVVRLFEEVTAVVFIALILATFFTVVIRDTLSLAYAWLDDVLRFLLIWSVYLGAIRLSVTNDHITMDALTTRLPRVGRRTLNVLVALLGITLGAVCTYLGWSITSNSIATGELSPSGVLPAWVGYVSIPVGFFLMALGYLRFLIAALRGEEERPQSQV